MKSADCKKYFAEALGVFALSFAVGASVFMSFPVATPVVAAVVVGIFVYLIGPVTGAQLNPAVTLALASLKKISIKEAGYYILAQFAGAVVSLLVLRWALGLEFNLIVKENWKNGLFEALGAFFLMFGIMHVVYGRVKDELSGVVIGGSLLIGITAASVGSAGILNPAVALALGSVSFFYVLGPIVGAVLGALAAQYMNK